MISSMAWRLVLLLRPEQIITSNHTTCTFSTFRLSVVYSCLAQIQLAVAMDHMSGWNNALSSQCLCTICSPFSPCRACHAPASVAHCERRQPTNLIERPTKCCNSCHSLRNSFRNLSVTKMRCARATPAE